MNTLHSLLAAVETGTFLWVICLAVIIAPWVVRARNRLRRFMRGFSLITVGFVLGIFAAGLPPSETTPKTKYMQVHKIYSHDQGPARTPAYKAQG